MKTEFDVSFEKNGVSLGRNGEIMVKPFNSHGADSELKKYDNCLCEVQRELTKEEADIDDVGRMYHIKFMDGYETDAFEDELI